jgi:hypothetical protein
MGKQKQWEVKTRPEPENPSPEGRNESGIIVFLDNGAQQVEVSRVLFVRRNAMNKSVGFKRQLLKEMDKAFEAKDVLNDSYTPDDEMDAAKLKAAEEGEKRRKILLDRIQEEGTPKV